jgi:hypothetical protein
MLDKHLTLRNELKRSYLIQRLHKPERPLKIAGKEIVDNPFSFGGGLVNGGISKEGMNLLRSIFSFDYMGSAEFEWGAVPAAISFLAEQSEKKNIVVGAINCLPVTKGEELVYYVCPIPYEEEVKKRLQALRQMKDKNICLKEHCGLKEYFDTTSERAEYAKRNLGWLELDNGFAFFVDKEMFDKFCKLLEIPDVKDEGIAE